MNNNPFKIAVILLFCTGLAACAEEGGSLRVGAKPFAESMILAEMIAQLAEAEGIAVERSIPFGTTQKIMEALKQDVLDIYPEYNGTSLVFLGQAPTSDGEASTATVQRLFEPLGLEFTAKFGFSNDYAMVMTRDRARELGVGRISDLRGAAIRYVVDDDFVQRPADGLQQMNRRYGITDSSVSTFPVGTEGKDRIVAALLDGEADVGELFMTDGQIAEYDLLVLEDDLGFFPVYEAAPLVRSDALATLTGLRELLNGLAGSITPADMQAMNKAVDLNAQSAASVAAAFLAEKGLLPEGAAAAGGAARIAVVGDAGIGRSIDTARALRAIRAGYAGSDLELSASGEPLATLAAGKARVAIVGAESFYALGDDGPRARNEAEAFAVLGYKTAHLIGLGSSVDSITAMSRISTGPRGSGSARVLAMLLHSLGLADRVEVVHGDGSPREQLLALAGNGYDAHFVMAPAGEREIANLMRGGFYKLIDLSEWAAGGHTARFSFIRPATVPADTYATQSAPVSSVSTQLVLASPARTVQTAGEVGPGTAGIDSSAAVPVSASAVKAIREALGESEVIDPALPVHGSLVPEITVVDKSLPFDVDISIVNILTILFTVWVIYLVSLPSPRDFKMPDDL